MPVADLTYATFSREDKLASAILENKIVYGTVIKLALRSDNGK